MELKVGIAGDFCFKGLASAPLSVKKDSIEKIRSLTSGVSLSIANFESVICAQTFPAKGVAVSHVEIDSIHECGFDLFCLANNHIMDEGVEGLRLTERALTSPSKCGTVGAGNSIILAQAPFIETLSNFRIAVINATDATHYRARNNKSGVNPLSRKKLLQQVRELVSRTDFIVVITHSDIEFSRYPSPWKVRLSRALIDAGANVVAHHHPHVLQGIERYHGGLIAYSLANFLFPVAQNNYMKSHSHHTNVGGFLRIDICTDRSSIIDFEFIPTIINDNNGLEIAADGDREEILRTIEQLAKPIADMHELRRLHLKNCSAEMSRFLRGAYYEFRKYGVRAGLAYIRIHFGTLMHRGWMRGYFSAGWL